MTNLGRRLTALEMIAEQARRREARLLALDVARELGWPEIPEDAIQEATEEILRDQDRVAAWHAEGLSERQIIQRFADKSGMSVEEFERECRAITEQPPAPS